jgi:E3 ubiquitin-protein ligase UBR4
MTFLATISYRKACSLKHLTDFGGEQLSFSDSTTYYNDTLSCSDDDDSDTEEEEEGEGGDDSDEESSDGYLGSWLKEALSPESNGVEGEQNKEKDKQDENKKSGAQVTARDEPHEYLELAAQIFVFLDSKLGDSENKFLVKYIRNGLSEQQMVLLANILKDLDSDVHNAPPMPLNSNNASSNDVSNAAIQWRTAMMKFSSAIGKYMHNLISNALLSESLQSLLLQNLGVSPWSNETNTWPLEVYSRILAVLVQILLLKPNQEKEAACLSVWHRLVNTLVEGE